MSRYYTPSVADPDSVRWLPFAYPENLLDEEVDAIEQAVRAEVAHLGRIESGIGGVGRYDFVQSYGPSRIGLSGSPGQWAAPGKSKLRETLDRLTELPEWKPGPNAPERKPYYRPVAYEPEYRRPAPESYEAGVPPIPVDICPDRRLPVLGSHTDLPWRRKP